MILIGCNGFLVKMNVLDAIVGSGQEVVAVEVIPLHSDVVSYTSQPTLLEA